MAEEYNYFDQFNYMAKLIEENSPLAISVGPGQWLVGNIASFNSAENDNELYIALHSGFVEYAPQRVQSDNTSYLCLPGSSVTGSLESFRSKFTNEAGIIGELGYFILDVETQFPEDRWQLVAGLVREEVASVKVSSQNFPERIEQVKLTKKKTFCWVLGRASEIYGDKFIFVAKDSQGQIIGQAETNVQNWTSIKLGKLLKQYAKVRLYEFIMSLNGKELVNSIYFRYLTDAGEIKLIGQTQLENTDLDSVIQVIKGKFVGVNSTIERLTKELNEAESDKHKHQLFKVLTEREQFRQIMANALRELEEI